MSKYPLNHPKVKASVDSYVDSLINRGVKLSSGSSFEVIKVFPPIKYLDQKIYSSIIRGKVFGGYAHRFTSYLPLLGKEIENISVTGSDFFLELLFEGGEFSYSLIFDKVKRRWKPLGKFSSLVGVFSKLVEKQPSFESYSSLVDEAVFLKHNKAFRGGYSSEDLELSYDSYKQHALSDWPSIPQEYKDKLVLDKDLDFIRSLLLQDINIFKSLPDFQKEKFSSDSVILDKIIAENNIDFIFNIPKEFYPNLLKSEDFLKNIRNSLFHHPSFIEDLPPIFQEYFSKDPILIKVIIGSLNNGTGWQYIEGKPSLYYPALLENDEFLSNVKKGILANFSYDDSEDFDYFYTDFISFTKDLKKLPEEFQKVIFSQSDFLTVVGEFITNVGWIVLSELPTSLTENPKLLSLIRDHLLNDIDQVNNLPEDLQSKFLNDDSIINKVKEAFLSGGEIYRQLPESFLRKISNDPDITSFILESLEEDWSEIRTLPSYLVAEVMDTEAFLNTASKQSLKNYPNYLLASEPLEPLLKEKLRIEQDQEVFKKFSHKIIFYKIIKSLDSQNLKLFSKSVIKNIDENDLKFALEFNNYLPDIENREISIDQIFDSELVAAPDLKLESVEVQDSDKEFLLNNTTEGNTHNLRDFRIINKFKVGNLGNESEYEAFKAEHPDSVVHPLFHGTGYLGGTFILRSGFQVTRGSLVKAGRAMGEGIYLAPNMDKSIQYCHDGKNVERHKGKGFIFECEVVLDGKDSHMWDGSRFLSPEVVVRDARKQIKILYAYEVEKLGR